MTRDELEAVIWRNVPGGYDKQVDAILTAADAYAAATLGEIDGYRRQRGPNRHQPPAVHWRDDFNVPACRRDGSMNDPVLSTSRAHVTCGACKRTSSYREAR